MQNQWGLVTEHSGTLIQLLKLLERLCGFHALIIQHNSQSYRDELIKFLNTSNSSSVTIDLKDTTSYAEFEQIFEQLAPKGSPLHVINLESLKIESRQEFFRGINYHREYLARLSKGIVVFWLPEPLIRDMAEEAADFWAWREQVLGFNISLEQPERLSEGWNKIVNLDSPAKRLRISEIENSLSPPTAKTTLSRADLKHELGRLYWSIGEYPQARQNMEAAIGDYDKLEDNFAKARVQRDLADILDGYGDKVEALALLKTKVLPVFTKLKDVSQIAKTYGQIADILQARERGTLLRNSKIIS